MKHTDRFHFTQITDKTLQFSFKNWQFSTFTTFSLYSWGSLDADFCISSAYVTSERSIFLGLQLSTPRRVKQIKHDKRHEILAFKSLLQEIWLKTLTSRNFLKLQHLSFKLKKIPATEPCRNGAKLNYVHPSMVLSKVFDRSIYVIAMWNSKEK